MVTASFITLVHTGALPSCYEDKCLCNFIIRSVIVWFNRDVDDAIVRPLPRIKRLLSEQTYLPHIVQLLLTFDPVLVEKVSTLLYHMMQDNPMLSRSEYLLCLLCFSIRLFFF